jgi:hypothetical protein
MTTLHSFQTRRSKPMPRHHLVIVACSILMAFASGCSSTNSGQNTHRAGQLPRPERVIVYDFASSPYEVSADSRFSANYVPEAPAPTPQQSALGREIGGKVAAQLVEEINAMGVPAVRGALGRQPKLNDIVLRGYLVSVAEGAPASSAIVGIGGGTSEFSAVVETFQKTPYGLTRLGAGATADPIGLVFSKTSMNVKGETAGSSRIEAFAKQVAAEIASGLKNRFQEQGWVNGGSVKYGVPGAAQ